MIKIIAVHPDVMSTPEGIREYLKDFGTARGRWIPLVPSNWKLIVSQAIKRHPSLGSIQRNALRDKIKHPKFADKYLKIDQCEIDDGKWCEVVSNFCNNGMFDAAIVTENTCVGEKSLIVHEFDPDCDLYAVRISGFFSRNPEQLANQVAPGLRFAKEIHVIDVYCKSQGTNCRSYGVFFKKLLDACKTTSPALTSITLHRRQPEDFDLEREEANYKSWLCRSLRAGETLKIRYLKERDGGDKMHIRAVFTNNLLITGHYGFGAGSSEYETTDLTLKEHSDLTAIRNLYLCDEKIGFDLMHEIEIQAES